MCIRDRTVATATVANIRYTVDQPPWAADSSTGMTASDGLFDSGLESASIVINEAELGVGRHLIYVYAETADPEGVLAEPIQGLPTAIFVEIPPLFRGGFESP